MSELIFIVDIKFKLYHIPTTAYYLLNVAFLVHFCYNYTRVYSYWANELLNVYRFDSADKYDTERTC